MRLIWAHIVISVAYYQLHPKGVFVSGDLYQVHSFQVEHLVMKALSTGLVKGMDSIGLHTCIGVLLCMCA